MSSRNRKRPQQSDPSSEENLEPQVAEHSEAGNGAALEAETGGETAVATEEPAQVQLTIKGSDRSARAAAKRFGGEATKAPAAPVVATPSNDAEPPDGDPIAELLSSGKNMVIVTRQTPRNIRDQRGQKIVTNVRLPGKYTCPTSIDAISEQVFDEHWGSTYKCTIHPDTSNGENTILGHFKIEHPDPKAPPFVEGVTDVEEPTEEPQVPMGGTDPTLHETDQLVKLRQDAERRIERARLRKEAFQMEQEAKRLEAELELGARPPAPVAPVGESDEVRKLKEQLAATQAQLAEKKVNDRFDSLENRIAGLADSIKAAVTAKPAVDGGESFAMQMLKQSQQHSKDMLTLVQQQNAPKPASSEDNLDKFLERVTKLQVVTGGGSSAKGSGRLSELESKLIDLSFDRLTGGGGDDDSSGDDVDDAVKLAIKQFAPIAKTYVDKKMDQEAHAAGGGGNLSKEQIQKIYAEAAQAAAKKVQDDLAVQGLQLSQTTDGRLVALPASKGSGKPIVPPRSAGTKVMSETRTSGGVVKKISIKPDDLTGRPKPATEEPSAPQAEPQKGGTEVPKCGVFPMLGPNGTELKIGFPVRPGELKYDRKYSVNFILDGIRSEIRQGLPEKAQTDQKIESYVVGDALEYLDDEMLDKLDNVDSGPGLETLLAPSGDADKIAEIKKSGENEAVASYLRRLVMAIQREWQREKGAPQG